MKTVGYARVSTRDQVLDLQMDALRRAGVADEHLFSDHGQSGAKRDRPGLAAALAALEPGDTLVVYKLDRVARSVRHTLDLVDQFRARGITFTSISDGLTITPQPSALTTAFLTVAAAFAELERGLLVERVRAGLEARKSRGGRLGPKQLLGAEDVQDLLRWREEGLSLQECADRLTDRRRRMAEKPSKRRVSKSTVWLYLRAVDDASAAAAAAEPPFQGEEPPTPALADPNPAPAPTTARPAARPRPFGAPRRNPQQQEG